MADAYHAGSALEAQAALLALAKELERTHPGAAASLREGLDETLIVLRLGVPPTLARTLRSTNTIESMIPWFDHQIHAAPAIGGARRARIHPGLSSFIHQ
jgi:transposase-like protein